MFYLITQSGVSGEDSTLFAWVVHFLLDIGLLHGENVDTPVTPVVATGLLEVDGFEIKILKFLIIILVLNIVAIYLAWKHYGPRIADRFMKPGNYIITCD